MKVFIFAAAMVLAACSGEKVMTVNNGVNPDIATLQTKIVYAWPTLDMTNSNAMLCAGIKDGVLYYLREWENRFAIQFTDFDGTFKDSITIPRGRGPGEVMQSMGVRFVDGNIMFADLVMSRISLFDEKGHYLDEYLMDEGIDVPTTFDVVGDKLIFTGLIRDKLTAMDYRTSDVIRTLPYEDGPYPMESGKTLDLCTMRSDPQSGMIFVAHASYPYRIDRYDSDLNRNMKIRKKLAKKYDRIKWSVPRANSVTGELMVISMVMDEKYLYASRGFNIKPTGEVDDTDFSIYVFEKSSGRFLYEIKNEKISRVRGGISVIGVTDEYIVLHMIDTGLAFARVFGKDDAGGSAMLVIEKPGML